MSSTNFTNHPYAIAIKKLIGGNDAEIIGSFCIKGTEGDYVLSFAPKGTVVESSNDGYYYEQEEDCIIWGWEQLPTYDNGYMRHEYPITSENADAVIAEALNDFYEEEERFF